MPDTGDLYNAQIVVGTTGAETAAAQIDRLVRSGELLDVEAQQLYKSLGIVSGAFAKMSDAAAADAAAQEAAAARYAKGFETRIAALNKFVAAQRIAAQESTLLPVGAPGRNAMGVANVQALSDAELASYKATNDAMNVSGIRQVEQEIARRKAAVDSAIAGFEREAAARTATYTQELQAALAADAQIASARDAKRYATVPNARRNTANPVAAAQAQDVYSGEQRAAMRQYYTDLEKTSAAEAAHAAAAGKSAAAQSAFSQSLSTSRYALYDASHNLAAVGAVLVGIPLVTSIVAAAYQRDFATVQRAMGDTTADTSKLKAQLVDLSTTIPVSFKKITDIAAQGLQLGVDPKGLVQYTKVVAELTATTNLSADAAGTFLGKFEAIAGVSPDNFDNLASAVLNVGISTAATEQQIAKTATQIVGIGKVAGFTVPQIVGLSAALASVSSTGPELSRGTVTRFVTDLQKAVISGGPALDAFAKTANVSALTVQKAFGTERFAGVFQKFVKGLNDVQENGGNATKVLNDMGISSVRDVPLILNLASGWKVLNTAMAKAEEGYKDQSILAAHYNKVNDTLISKSKELGNAFLAWGDQLGSLSTGPIEGVVEGLTGMVEGITDLTSSPFGQWVAISTLALIGFVGLLALGGAAAVRGVAGYIGLIQSLRAIQVESAGATGFLAGLNAELAATGTFGARAAAGLRVAGAAARGFGIIGIGAAVVTGASIASGELDKFLDQTRGWKSDIDAIMFRATDRDLFGLGKSALKSDVELDDFARGMDRFFSNANFGTAAGRQVKELDDSLAGLANDKNIGELGDRLSEASKKSGVSVNELIQKSFPALRGALAENNIAVRGSADSLVVYEIQTAKQKAATEKLAAAAGVTVGFMTQLQNATGLNAKSITDFEKSYTKSVASLYDFNTVVGQVQQAQTDAVNATAKANNVSADEDDLNKAKTVSLGAYVAQLEANNAKQHEWATGLAALNTELASQFDPGTAQTIVSQITAAGYSATSNSILQQLVNATPEQRAAYVAATGEAMTAAGAAAGQALITAGGLVTANGGQIGADTATQIGAELLAGFDPAQIMAQFNLVFANNPGKPQVSTDDATTQISDFYNTWANKQLSWTAVINTVVGPTATPAWVHGQGPDGNGGYTGGYFDGNSSNRFSNFAGGGFTGAGGKFEYAGAVHRGEYVFSSEATRNIGVDNLAYVHSQAKRGRPIWDGSTGGNPFGSGGSNVMQLSPYDRQLLEQIRDSSGVSFDGNALQKMAGATAVDSNRRGAA